MFTPIKFFAISSLLLVLGRSALAAPFQTFSDEQRWLKLTERYFEEGRYDLAQRHVEELLAANPLHQEALLYHARIAMARMDDRGAEMQLRRVIRIHPSREALQLLELCLERQGKFPENETRHEGSGSEGRAPEEMVEQYKQLTSENAPNLLRNSLRWPSGFRKLGSYWALRAKANRLQRRNKEALAALRRALSYAPDNALVRFETARFWESQNRLDRAAEHLGYLVAIQPENAKAAYHFARLQMLRNRADLAAHALRAREYLFPDEHWIAESRNRFIAKIDETPGPLFVRCEQHTIAPGETLEGLSASYLGSPARWEEVFHSNREIIEDPDLLPVGLRIQVCLPAS